MLLLPLGQCVCLNTFYTLVANAKETRFSMRKPAYFQQVQQFYLCASIFRTMEAIRILEALGKQLQTDPVFNEKMQRAEQYNAWFTPGFVQAAVDAITGEMLTAPLLNAWLQGYPLKQVDKTVGLIMAGNIPLVGFHDFLCCYIAGVNIKIKLSSKDDLLFPRLLELLGEIDPPGKARIQVVDRLSNFDAVIATGSDNTHRYFEYYFKDYPKILRKNRNSVAVLNGQESDTQLEQLANDIFMYFGFGCRNVSKLFVPAGYDLKLLFPRFSAYAWLHNHTKYMNNYDYNRTILLLNNTPHLANEFIMIVENEGIASPIGTLNIEYWHDEQVLQSKLRQQQDKIQCIVSGEPAKWEVASSVSFGQSQHPALSDYADGVDTMAFLLGL